MKKEIAQSRIYVACLAAYNNGKLHGRWIEANQDAHDIRAEVTEMLKSSPEPMAEEWAIHDYEGYGEIRLSEWESLDRVSVLASLIEPHGDAFSIWYVSQDAYLLDDEELEEKFIEQWQGAHKSESAFADYLLDESGQLSQVPEWARNYFDFASYARDLRLGGDYTFVSHNAQVYVYSNY